VGPSPEPENPEKSQYVLAEKQEPLAKLRHPELPRELFIITPLPLLQKMESTDTNPQQNNINIANNGDAPIMFRVFESHETYPSPKDLMSTALPIVLKLKADATFAVP
jgi:hypothetical protein